MTRLLLTALFCLTALAADLYAQITPRVLPARVEDAVRFGTTQPLGTARFAGTGGSMTSIGVDYTTLHTNPAGIGWNRFSSAQITPGFNLTNIDTQLRGNANNATGDESKGAFVVPSLGLVWAGDTRSINWSTFNWGVGLTRLADFNETISFEGQSGGSVIDAIVEDLNDGVGDPFRTDLIFDIDPSISTIALPIEQDDRGILNDGISFYSDFDLDANQSSQIDRQGRVERTGGMNEFAVGAGGNYKEKLLWGITLGIPFMNFTETKIYDEIDRRDEVTSFDDAGYDETLEMNGSGVNFKLGLILRPTDNLRFSGAVHTPTFWTINETFFTTLEYNYTIGDEARGGTGLSPRSEAVFNLQTPWKFMVGAGALIGRSGFISVDADYQNFASSSFSTEDFATLDEFANNDVDATLGSALGIRVGGELNLKPFQIRAGVGYRQLPTIDTRYEEDEALLNYSGGVGYSVGKFFIDAAVRYQANSSYYAAYRTFAFDGNIVDTDRSQLTALVTVGIRGF